MQLFRTAECVTPKHPDKVCDRISDAILDLCLSQDPMSRVAVETMGGHGKLYILGEITTKAIIGNHAINAICKRIAGQDASEIKLVQQSPEIAQGVDTGGAGDQGIMVGYACDDNEEMIPQELYLARSLCKHIYKKHQQDGKTQVTIDQYGNLVTIVASFCHVAKQELEELVKEWATITPGATWSSGLGENRKIFCNPAGDWDQGGFEADTGLTGRKLAVDNYGPGVPIGGGAFSGKDATKVDRSAAYMARRIAVDLLERNKAKEVIVKLAYSIGIAEPVMAVAEIDGYRTQINLEKLDGDLSPRNIIESLELDKPIYEKTAEWGHFGNGFKWDEKRELRGFPVEVDWPTK